MVHRGSRPAFPRAVVHAVSCALIALLAACGSPSQRPSAAEFSAPALPEALRIIDVHTHTAFDNTPEPTSGIMDSAASYRDALRRAGAVGSVSHVGVGGEANDGLDDLNMTYCVGVGDRVDVREIEERLEDARHGCIKIYLGYYHRYANDAAYAPLYRLAAKHDVPVVFHTGDTYSKSARVKFSDPLPIDDVAVDNPDVTFLIAHLGNPWIQSAAEVAYKNDNVYIEGSALLIGSLADRDPETVRTYLIDPVRWAFGYVENPDKLLFGSDWPLTDIEPYARAYAQAIPEEHWQAVFHDNALRVFPRLRDRLAR